MATDSGDEFTVTVKRNVAFSRERVFAAWTDPLSVESWFAPGGMDARGVEMDVRTGGSFRIGMQSPNGETVYAVGEYRELSPPERLVFTWIWEGDDDFPETVVTVEFHDRGGSTDISLVHDGLSSEESRARHEDGWVGFLEKLEPALG